MEQDVLKETDQQEEVCFFWLQKNIGKEIEKDSVPQPKNQGIGSFFNVGGGNNTGLQLLLTEIHNTINYLQVQIGNNKAGFNCCNVFAHRNITL